MPIMTQLTKDQININKQQLSVLNPDPSEVFATGQNPILQLEIETGGTAAQVQVVDEASGHALASLEYVRSAEELYIALLNKTSGAWRTLLEIKPDGTATIGDGMTQHQIATMEDIAGLPRYFDVLDKRTIDLNTLKTNGRYYTDGANRPPHSTKGILEVMADEATGHIIQFTETDGDFKKYLRAFDGAGWSAWVEDNISHIIGLSFSMIIGKASKTSLPVVFNGEAAPLDTAGKNYDRFIQHKSGTSISVNLFTGASVEAYDPYGFALAASQTPQNHIYMIEIFPNYGNTIYIDLADQETLPIEDIALIINGTTIPLTVKANQPGSFEGTYDQSFDSVMASVTSSTPFVLRATEGAVADTDYHYEKHFGHWELDQTSLPVIVTSGFAHNTPSKAEIEIEFAKCPNFNYGFRYTFMADDSHGFYKIEYYPNGDTAQGQSNYKWFWFEQIEAD